jgi:predicted nucleic acid-binding Zn finger protein
MCLEKVDCEHMIKLQYKFDKDQFTDTEVETFTEFIQTSAEGDTDTIEKLMPGVAAASVVE